MTFKELKEFFDITLNKEKWEVPIVRLFTQDEVEAMLTDIQLEIEESESCGKAFHLGLQMASNIIQEKINALKADSEGKHDTDK